MPVSDAIRELVERFEQNREAYRSSKYNETQLRREFLDPFFKALGWDMDNEQGYAEAYKDVIHEDSLEIEGETKAPDYAFRIGGTRKFFLEAKKPAVNIQYDIHPAFQLRRYAWSAKLPLSILSDFEEFAVYDCRGKPDKNDQASTSRVMLLTYRDYVQKWDEIAAVFSREAVLKGSFDSYAEGMKGKKGTTEVDDAFLAEIERWRDLLARNIAIRNPSLSVRELNYAVQMTIDRIIFLRICEDRGVERDGQLKEIATPPPPSLRDTSPISTPLCPPISVLRNGGMKGGQGGREGVYSALCQLFQKADARYNSGLFHFKDEKEPFSSAADSLTLGLQIDDKILKDIIGNLYYPDSPYVFKVISSDILGQVYERFLGKVIRLTAGHQAKVEEKPEVRKAGGVYYTPTYIVDYIVINTLGKLLDPSPGPSPDPTPDPSPGPSPDGRAPSGEGGMTTRQAACLKILDPACGSGTFLLSAYQYLLDWHLKWYMEHELEKWAVGKNPAIYQTTPPPSLRDTSPISACASAAGTGEVRNGGGQGGGWKLTTAKKKEILLNNIFGVDIDAQAVEVTKLSLLLKVLEGESNETIGSQLALFQERVLPDLGRNIQCGNSLIGFDYFEGRMFVEQEERERVNAFDWQAAFPQVFGPYRPSPFEDTAATSPKSDWGSSDLGEAGRGFDVVIGNPPYGIVFDEDLKLYLEKCYPAFMRNNDTYTAFIDKSLSLLRQNGLFGFIIPNTYLLGPYFDTLKANILSQARVSELIDFGTIQIFQKPNVFTGLLFFEKGYPSEKSETPTRFVKVENIKSFPLKLDFCILDTPTLATLRWSPVNLLVARLLSNDTKLENLAWVKDVGLNYWTQGRGKTRGGSIADRVLYDGEKQYSDDKPYLKGRDIDRYSIRFGNHWLRHDYQKRLDPKIDTLRFSPGFLEREKITYRQTADHIIASLDLSNMLTDKTVHVVVLRDEWVSKLDLRYLLGILNSHLLTYLYKATSQEEGRTFAQVKTFRMKELPICIPIFSDPAEKAMHDKMVSLVERMLALHKQSPRTPQEQESLQREIVATDGQIDRLVYELYGLSEEEIKVVES